MKWLGIKNALDCLFSELERQFESGKLLVGEVNELRAENGELIQRLDIFASEFVKVGVRIENLREHYASVKEMGDACMARLDRETMKLAEAIGADRDAAKKAYEEIFADIKEGAKLGGRDSQRIAELEAIVKDATLDTALSALEDRVAKLESAPAPTGPQGRRGGSAWGPHQIAASAGAARANGADVPLPTPGVS